MEIPNELTSEERESMEIIENADSLTPTVAAHFHRLWQTPRFQAAAYKYTLSPRLNSESLYHYQKIEEIAKTDYDVTSEDLIHTYMPSSGVVTLRAEVGDKQTVELFDTSGRQAHKWSSKYGECDMVVFVVALDSCFMVLEEETPPVNGLEISLRLWSEVTQNEKVNGKPFILVLNKQDVFVKKIKRRVYHEGFPDMDPKKVFDEEYCLSYVIDKFRDRFRGCFMMEWVLCALRREEISKFVHSMASLF